MGLLRFVLLWLYEFPGDSCDLFHDDFIKWKIFRVTGLCEWNLPVTSGLPSQRPVTLSFDIVFDLRLNKRLGKQPRRWWFETPWRLLWHYRYSLSCLLHWHMGKSATIFQRLPSWFICLIYGRNLTLSIAGTLPTSKKICIVWSVDMNCYQPMATCLQRDFNNK